LTKPLASGKEVNFYREKLGNKTVLEAMCGSGRLLIPLLKAELKVDGLDYSSEMLAHCQERLEGENLSSTLYEQNIEKIDLPQQYDAIIIAIGSFQLLHPREIALNVIIKMKKFLTPAGQIFIETFVPWEALYENNEYEEEERGVEKDSHTKIHLRSVNHADRFHQFIKSKNFYKKIHQGKIIHSEEEELYVNWYYRYEMVYFLEKAGFKNVELHEVNFSQNPMGIVYVGQKI
jgi:SAM-dependent methyltransferase